MKDLYIYIQDWCDYGFFFLKRIPFFTYVPEHKRQSERQPGFVFPFGIVEPQPRPADTIPDISGYINKLCFAELICINGWENLLHHFVYAYLCSERHIHENKHNPVPDFFCA